MPTCAGTSLQGKGASYETFLSPEHLRHSVSKCGRILEDPFHSSWNRVNSVYILKGLLVIKILFSSNLILPTLSLAQVSALLEGLKIYKVLETCLLVEHKYVPFLILSQRSVSL